MSPLRGAALFVDPESMAELLIVKRRSKPQRPVAGSLAGRG
jgi:hypothetical protein